MKKRSAAGLVLAWIVPFAGEASTPPKKTPADFLKATVETYKDLSQDSSLKNGEIGEFLKRPDIRDLSENDKKAIERALIDGTIVFDAKYEYSGTVLKVSDPRLAEHGPIEIDFRDYSVLNSRVVYVNNVRFELKYLEPNSEPGKSQLVQQLESFKKFWFATQVHAALPGLDSKQSVWAANGLQILFAPFALLTGCDNPSKWKNDLLPGAALRENSCADAQGNAMACHPPRSADSRDKSKAEKHQRQNPAYLTQ